MSIGRTCAVQSAIQSNRPPPNHFSGRGNRSVFARVVRHSPDQARVSKRTEDLGRLAVSEFVEMMLDAEAKAEGSNKQAIAHEVLDKWARRRHRAFKVYARRLRANGLQMEFDGIDAEDDGEPSK